MTDHSSVPESATSSRRSLIGGVLGAGVALPLLVACGSSADSSGGSGSGAGSTASKGPIGATSDVPVGGGKIFTAEKVVVTQPTAGDFKGFSAVCTHQGCPVSKIEGEDIVCTCHGSKFSIKDGSVVNGPATKSLSAVKVTVSGSDLSVS